MATDKKQTLQQILNELPMIDTNLREYSKAILDCALEGTYKERCLESILVARAQLKHAEIFLEAVKAKQ